MTWLAALIKGILDWLSGEVKKDVKAGDADDIPKDLKDRWRSRIEQQLKKEKQPEKKKDEKREYLTDSQRETLEKEDDQDSSGN